LSISEEDIQRYVDKLYDAGRKIMPRDTTVVDMLAVLGATSAALFVHLHEAHGAEKITPIFAQWLSTMAETSGLDGPLHRFSIDQLREWFDGEMETTAGSAARSDTGDVVH
jgi:hypothetical protein